MGDRSRKICGTLQPFLSRFMSATWPTSERGPTLVVSRDVKLHPSGIVDIDAVKRL
jgi:hypothetical protein